MQRFTQDVGGMIGLKSRCVIIVSGLLCVSGTTNGQQAETGDLFVGGACWLTVEDGTACGKNPPSPPDGSIGGPIPNATTDEFTTDAITASSGKETYQTDTAICVQWYNVDTNGDGAADQSQRVSSAVAITEATGLPCDSGGLY